jgi:formylmethanofuran dehydrogenase subunit E
MKTETIYKGKNRFGGVVILCKNILSDLISGHSVEIEYVRKKKSLLKENKKVDKKEISHKHFFEIEHVDVFFDGKEHYKVFVVCRDCGEVRVYTAKEINKRLKFRKEKK